ncbi:uncharacterized protein C9orf50 homolog [Balaenoptera ricei]|uniref:uncharacterized protein C9orf50 homolog n=1 Tax=Balaenoptera ricei TaxID=2746895 RepID=UPI0028BD2472|nr:uncharacterized protein C9orf50 homolog [Balaenoptera ricei]
MAWRLVYALLSTSHGTAPTGTERPAAAEAAAARAPSSLWRGGLRGLQGFGWRRRVVRGPRVPHATQAPKLKAVLTHNYSGEGSGHRRRCCPFRVRFAEETLRDTALRYWERSCAVRQGILENRTASGSAASEQVFGSVGRWLESLPKVLYPRAKEDTMANSFGWDFPGLSTLEPKGHLSEDTSMNSSLPFIPRGSGGTSKPFWSRSPSCPAWCCTHGPETRPP